MAAAAPRYISSRVSFFCPEFSRLVEADALYDHTLFRSQRSVTRAARNAENEMARRHCDAACVRARLSL
jgi:hypothetical protein